MICTPAIINLFRAGRRQAVQAIVVQCIVLVVVVVPAQTFGDEGRADEENRIVAAKVVDRSAIQRWFAERTTTIAGEVSFRRDVMAVLSKAGCNMGACHGNQNGKGGLLLSLRGQDPDFDHASLARDLSGRRIDRLAPERSLMLLKPTGQLAHQGGVRFGADSPEYQILHQWITAGAAGPKTEDPPLVRLDVTPTELAVVGEANRTVPLRVTAVFENGDRVDVTRLATYEPADLAVSVTADGIVERQAYGEATVLVRYLDRQVPVRLAFIPDRPSFTWADPPANNYVDRLIYQKLESLRINPSEISPDSVFVRRAHLDALGIPPTAEEARRFVMDTSSDKRDRLIDQLIARPEFADLWALKWSDILRNEEKVLDARGVEAFHGWIRQSMADGKPIDRFVRELVRGTGSTYDHPAANFYRANRDPSTRGETTARLFLGVRLQCAKCHNHPFDRWTQDDYYQWSAIFARIDYDILKNERRDDLDKNEFNGEQVVKVAEYGAVQHPRSGRPVWPKMLGGDPLSPGSYHDRLTPLAVWLTSAENTAFAKSQVNFIWYHLMGRGLIEPMDDVRSTNPPSNAPLLDALASDFVRSGFDLRHMVRVIMRSRVYQLSAIPNETNSEDIANFSRAIVQRLPAEKLIDSQSQVLDAPADFSGYPKGRRAGELPAPKRPSRSRGRSVPTGDRFLKTFGKPERLLACECERSNETALAQAFTLISGDELNSRLSRSGNRIEQLARSPLSNEEVIDELYWTALCRGPSQEELQAALSLLSSGSDSSSAQSLWLLSVPVTISPPPDRFAALQDITWALLNAKEFIFRN